MKTYLNGQIKQLVKNQGWNEQSLLLMLEMFIKDQGLETALTVYLKQLAEAGGFAVDTDSAGNKSILWIMAETTTLSRELLSFLRQNMSMIGILPPEALPQVTQNMESYWFTEEYVEAYKAEREVNMFKFFVEAKLPIEIVTVVSY